MKPRCIQPGNGTRMQYCLAMLALIWYVFKTTIPSNGFGNRFASMIIAGNWKMNLTRQEAVALTTAVIPAASDNLGIILFPPSILIDTVRDHLASGNGNGGEGIALGGQDSHAAASGPHTGDIAAPMLKEAGCTWVLLGHSERRADHGETSAMVAAKAVQAIAHDLAPMICVGESLDDRQSGRAGDVVEHQLRDSLTGVEPGACFAIAYEPIWAIGTGKTAGAGDIAQMHGHIRSVLTSINADHASVPILYGGSVKPGNAGDIFDQQHVDGALVGGASLDADQFLSIIRSARSRA